MPHALSAVPIQLVFSTKDRRPFLRDKDQRDALHAMIATISQRIGCPVDEVGGVEDHIHILARLGRGVTQSEWVKELKRVSTTRGKAHCTGYADFSWQAGYAAFSVDTSNLLAVCSYIRNQEAHHKVVPFQDELKSLLAAHRLTYDELYLWD